MEQAIHRLQFPVGALPVAMPVARSLRASVDCRSRIIAYKQAPTARSSDKVFPDPTIIWRPWPSIIDGIERPPLTSHLGLWRGVLHLIVVAPSSGLRAYGITIECEVHAGFDEMIYSIADHGEGATYDGNVYIKEAERSALISAYTEIDPTNRTPRHFMFVGNNYCYEVLSFSEPAIRAFDTPDEAYAWGPQRTD